MLLEVSQAAHVARLGQSDVRHKAECFILPLNVSAVVYFGANVISYVVLWPRDSAALDEAALSANDHAHVKVVLTFDDSHGQTVHVGPVRLVDLLGQQMTLDGVSERALWVVPYEDLAISRYRQQTDLQLDLIIVRQAKPGDLRDRLTMEVLVSVRLAQQLDRFTTETLARVGIPDEDLAVD